MCGHAGRYAAAATQALRMKLPLELRIDFGAIHSVSTNCNQELDIFNSARIMRVEGGGGDTPSKLYNAVDNVLRRESQNESDKLTANRHMPMEHAISFFLEKKLKKMKGGNLNPE